MELAVISGGRRALEKASPDFKHDYDVVVVGLGTAGAPALKHCIASGLKSLGVERLTGMGGLGTLGIVCFGDGIVNGLRNLERDCSGADVLYETCIVGVWMDGVRIAGVRLVSNGRKRDFRTKMVIDATGNGTVARLAGVKLRKGREIDGVMAPCSRGETWMDNGSDKLRPIYRNYPIDLTLSSREFSDSAIFLSGERHRFWLKQKTAGRMVRPSLMIGAREECRVETEEIVTLADAISEKEFPDPLFFASEPEDLPVFYDDHAFESEEIRNWKVHAGLPMFRFPSSVPYGTIVAKGVDNLFVPSKHFGVSHDLGGSLRMQPELRKCGIAAAYAARIAVDGGLKARDVPYEMLKPHIEKAGCLVRRPGTERMNVYLGKPFDRYSDEQVVKALHVDVTRTAEWWQGAVGQASGTEAECAAYAYWTAWKCRVSGSEAERRALADRLASAMSKEGRYAGNYAIALGLMKDRRALPVLREIVAHPGCAKDPAVKRAYPNRIKAIDMLRQFSDRESIPLLQGIVKDAAKTFVAGLAEVQAFGGGEPICRFQALSYAMMALREMKAKIPKVDFPKFVSGLDGADLAEKLRRMYV